MVEVKVAWNSDACFSWISVGADILLRVCGYSSCFKWCRGFVEIGSYPRVYFELVFSGFTLIMGMSLSSAFLSIFADELDPSGVLVGFVVSAFFFSRIFVELPSGVLADWLGRRKLLVGGLALSAVGAFLCSMSVSVYLLIVGRALWGLGTALFFISNTAIMFSLFKSRVRGRALGTFQSIQFLGSLLGAPIGAFIAGFVGYRPVFGLASLLILCSLSVAFVSSGLKRLDAENKGKLEFSWGGMFSLLRSWDLAALCFNSFSRMFIMAGVITTVFPLFLNHQLGISVGLIGVIMSLRTVGVIFATVTSGYLSDRFGRKPMVVLGILLQSVCFYAYTIVSEFEPFLFVGFFGGFGSGMTMTSLIVLLSEVVPARIRGGAVGMYRTFMDVGGFFGPPFFMFLFNSLGSYVAFISAIAILASNVALTVTIRGRKTE